MDFVSIGYPLVAFLGLVFGSFAGASVWRLRARQLVEDEKELRELGAKKKLSADEVVYLEELKETKADRAKELKHLRPLTAAKLQHDRSRCLNCHHELAWYDLLPLVSWLSTSGKCRYCGKPIGNFEPLIEIGTATLFALAYHYLVIGAPGLMALFWLIILVLLVILTAYDRKWFLLPDVIMFPLIALAAVYAGYTVIINENPLQVVVNALLSVAILSGVYLVLWLASKGRLIGFGDIKLGLALGLLLLDWRLALLALFAANLIGTLIILPGLITRRLSRQSQVPFGPFLVLGFFIALFWGEAIINSYNIASIWLTGILFML